MPIFAYQCGVCGHRFDALQKLNADPIRACPECNAPGLRKLLSAPHVHSRAGKATKEPQAPKKRPRLLHTFDSPQPHAEHHSHGHKHEHKHDQKQ